MDGAFAETLKRLAAEYGGKPPRVYRDTCEDDGSYFVGWRRKVPGVGTQAVMLASRMNRPTAEFVCGALAGAMAGDTREA